MNDEDTFGYSIGGINKGMGDLPDFFKPLEQKDALGLEGKGSVGGDFDDLMADLRARGLAADDEEKNIANDETFGDLATFGAGVDDNLPDFFKGDDGDIGGRLGGLEDDGLSALKMPSPAAPSMPIQGQPSMPIQSQLNDDGLKWLSAQRKAEALHNQFLEEQKRHTRRDVSPVMDEQLVNAYKYLHIDHSPSRSPEVRRKPPPGVDRRAQISPRMVSLEELERKPLTTSPYLSRSQPQDLPAVAAIMSVEQMEAQLLVEAELRSQQNSPQPPQQPQQQQRSFGAVKILQAPALSEPLVPMPMGFSLLGNVPGRPQPLLPHPLPHPRQPRTGRLPFGLGPRPGPRMDTPARMMAYPRSPGLSHPPPPPPPPGLLMPVAPRPPAFLQHPSQTANQIARRGSQPPASPPMGPHKIQGSPSNRGSPMRPMNPLPPGASPNQMRPQGPTGSLPPRPGAFELSPSMVPLAPFGSLPPPPMIGLNATGHAVPRLGMLLHPGAGMGPANAPPGHPPPRPVPPHGEKMFPHDLLYVYQQSMRGLESDDPFNDEYYFHHHTLKKEQAAQKKAEREANQQGGQLNMPPSPVLSGMPGTPPRMILPMPVWQETKEVSRKMKQSFEKEQSDRTRKWEKGNHVLGHFEKATHIRPKNQLSLPDEDVKKDAKSENVFNSDLWDTRAWVEKANQCYLSVEELRNLLKIQNLPPDKVEETKKRIDKSLHDLGRAFGLQEEDIDFSQLQAMLVLMKGQRALSRSLVLLAPAQRWRLLPAILAVTLSSIPPPSQKQKAESAKVEEKLMRTLLEMIEQSRVPPSIETLEMTLQTIIAIHATNNTLRQALSTNIARAELMEAILQKGSDIVETSSDSQKQSWSEISSTFMKMATSRG